MSSTTSSSSHAGAQDHRSSVKETLVSIIIAFALAFVFRGFVIEAFLIPTGSMAPTLMGAHMRFNSPQSGYDWAVTPWYYQAGTGTPSPVQGGRMEYDSQGQLRQQNSVVVHDPMSGLRLERTGVPRRWGDRIFVMKYLYSIYDPQRFDVVVFKNPRDPTVNYIKRLVGLPGEQVALIDGDVFRRTPTPGEDASVSPWVLPGWTVARKPERAQREMWQEVFDSRYTPLSEKRDGVRWFRSPWKPAGSEAFWRIEDRRDYSYAGQTPTTLEWDVSNPTFGRILDSYAYNEGPTGDNARFPVGDLRLSLGIRPESASQVVCAVVVSRGHEFRARIGGEGDNVALEMRPVPRPETENAWVEVARGSAPGALSPGKVTNIEFWHVDQSMQLFVEGRRVVNHEYEWTPEQRLERALGLSFAEVTANPALLISGDHYTRPGARWEFAGGAFTLYRVGMARDIHYRADLYPPENDNRPRGTHSRSGDPALGTHPSSTVVLNGDQFFVCGDNSPQSLDARLWDVPNPWVQEIDKTMGVVNRDLLIGKAFFVYFPALYSNKGIPVPDFGSMRFIW